MGDNYVIAFCTKIQEEGIAPVEAVENDIRFTLIKDKKAEVIEEEFTRNNQEGKTLNDIANSLGLNVQEATGINFRSYTVPGIGTEPALVAAASAEKQGVVGGPVKGNNGVFMFYVNSLTTSEGQDLNEVQKNMMASFQMRGGYEAYEALRKQAKIVDKRYKFY